MLLTDHLSGILRCGCRCNRRGKSVRAKLFNLLQSWSIVSLCFFNLFKRRFVCNQIGHILLVGPGLNSRAESGWPPSHFEASAGAWPKPFNKICFPSQISYLWVALLTKNTFAPINAGSLFLPQRVSRTFSFFQILPPYSSAHAHVDFSKTFWKDQMLA